MEPNFEVIFLRQAIEFLNNLDVKERKKIYYNVDKARLGLDPKVFKKLTDEIWEFRITYRGLQYRFFAFWDRRDYRRTLVLSTHGIIKKRSKIPKAEIEKAKRIRKQYFEK